ncbi:hypothetical protein [Helicobacter suis]|uniref:hypothetical protein n=1 Tax=Helicobacter suis TaxID=104628 RepID=UPI0013D5708F|nr:hypothetical protein [Helicobacter suis]
MLYIPPTSKEVYVSGIVALNIYCPELTGDWHSSSSLRENAFPMDIYIYGKNQKYNTNHLLDDLGVIDGTKRLNDMGYYPENAPIYIADHPRACVDYLYTSVLQSGILGEIMLDEWFPTIEDKQRVYDLLEMMQPKLNSEEREVLVAWMARNPIVE